MQKEEECVKNIEHTSSTSFGVQASKGWLKYTAPVCQFQHNINVYFRLGCDTFWLSGFYVFGTLISIPGPSIIHTAWTQITF